MKQNRFLLLTTCMSSLLFHTAHAETVLKPAKTKSQLASAKPAAKSKATSAPKTVKEIPAKADQAESIIVMGAGAARETQKLSHLALQQVAPGTSPLKTIVQTARRDVYLV